MTQSYVLKECPICGRAFKPCKPTSVTCSARCRNVHTSRKTAEKRSQKLLEKSSDASGYTKRNGRHQHRIVAEAMLGRPLLSSEIVHHKDGNKRNNNPENLEVMTQSEHCKKHFRKHIECSVDGCERPHVANGLCRYHYEKKRREVMQNV